MTDRRKRAGVLAATTLALAMMTIDVSIVRVALPTIQNDLELSDATQQWIVNAYLLTMGTLAIAGGRAGDRFGRRRVFLVGVLIFVGCSILGGVAGSGTVLVAARAGQGVGAAIMTAGNIALVADAFSGESLGKAMGVLVGVGTVGISVGALVGGFLIEAVGWRSIFFINVPVSAIVLALVVAYVPERRAEVLPDLDVAGLVALVAGMTALTLALVQLPVWPPAATAAMLLAASLALAVWLRIERRAREPLVDLRVLRGPMLAGNFVAFCVPFVLSGFSVLLAIYLQVVLDYDALETGALMLPLTIPGLIGSLASGWLTAKLGARFVVTSGMLLAGAGVFASGVSMSSSGEYLAMLPGLIVFAFGGGVALPPMTATIMANAEIEERGMVSGVYNTARLTGATLGLAAMGATLGLLEGDRISDEQANGKLTSAEATHVHNLLAGGESLGALDSLGPKQVEQTEQELGVVFDSAFATTLKLSSLVAVAGAIVAFFVVPRLRAPPHPQASMVHSALAEA